MQLANGNENANSYGLTHWWWFVAPLGVLLFQLACRYADGGSDFYFDYIETERGLIENLTAVVLIPAAYFAFMSAHRMNRNRLAGPQAWYLIVGLVCVAFFGEEISWGQQWIGWESPEFFAQYNRQGETNVHNMNLHFGRIAKTILTIAIVVGGLILPIWRWRQTRNSDPCGWEYLWPPFECVFTAGLVLSVRIVERIKTWFDLEHVLFIDMNLKELQELYLAYFLLLYLWYVHCRVQRNSTEDFAVTQQ